MSSRVSDSDRALYSQLVDVLLPASGDLPAASDAAVAGPMLDHILDWRPDLAPLFLRGLIAVRGMAAPQAVEHLQANDDEAFQAIRMVALGAYYLDAEVMKALGYTGQQSNPVATDKPADYLQTGLLDPVIQRGAIWRRLK